MVAGAREPVAGPTRRSRRGPASYSPPAKRHAFWVVLLAKSLASGRREGLGLATNGAAERISGRCQSPLVTLRDNQILADGIR